MDKKLKQKDKIVINYCKALEAGKFDDALSYLSKSAQQELEKAGGKSVLAAAANAFKTRKGLKNITISKRDILHGDPDGYDVTLPWHRCLDTPTAPSRPSATQRVCLRLRFSHVP